MAKKCRNSFYMDVLTGTRPETNLEPQYLIKSEIQGFLENLHIGKHEKLVPTNKKVNIILLTFGVEAKFEELRGVGKFNKDKKKSRTVPVTLVLVKNFDKRNELNNENIF